MTVIDIHTHMLSREWVEVLRNADSKYYLKRTETHPEDPISERIYINGLPYAFHSMHPARFDWDLRIKNMDEAGVDVAVVSLTAPQANFGNEQVSLRAAVVSNDDMVRQQEKYAGRVRFLAAIPWLYPEVAIQELDRACRNGAVGVFTCANVDGESLLAPRFAQIWEEIDRRALPVLVHPTAPPGVEVIAQYGLHQAVGFHFDTTHALERMMNTGFLDLYPNLKIIGSHAGGFLPFIMGRLEEQRLTDRNPADYLKRIYVDSMAWSDGALALALEVMGPDNIVFGSDYPYGGLDGMVKFTGMLEKLPTETADKIRSGNAQKIFDL